MFTSVLPCFNKMLLSRMVETRMDSRHITLRILEDLVKVNSENFFCPMCTVPEAAPQRQAQHGGMESLPSTFRPGLERVEVITMYSQHQ